MNEKIDRSQISDGFHTFGELYRERSALTAALANVMLTHDSGSAWVGYDSQPGFDGYRNVLYLSLPSGQVSWHFSDTDAIEFLQYVPRNNERQYDGHSTPEKYARMEAFARGES